MQGVKRFRVKGSVATETLRAWLLVMESGVYARLEYCSIHIVGGGCKVRQLLTDWFDDDLKINRHTAHKVRRVKWAASDQVRDMAVEHLEMDRLDASGRVT